VTPIVAAQSVSVNGDSTMAGGAFSFILGGGYTYYGPLAPSPSAQAGMRAIAGALNKFPTLCGGGAFSYAGREYSTGAVTMFEGQIQEIDAETGASSGQLVEGSVGEGIQGGGGVIFGSNGQNTGLVFGGTGVHTPVGGGAAGLVAFPGGGIGLYGELSGGTFAAGGGVYTNFTSVGNCR
jgi:hypothetical protein